MTDKNMKKHKMCEADDTMISIIKDNYSILQSLDSFGVDLGFGDKTVREVCEALGVDTCIFLPVVNFSINDYRIGDDESLSVATLLHCLKSSPECCLEF